MQVGDLVKEKLTIRTRDFKARMGVVVCDDGPVYVISNNGGS